MINGEIIDIAIKLKYGLRKAKSTAGEKILALDDEGLEDLLNTVTRCIKENEDDQRLVSALVYVIEFISARKSTNILENSTNLVLKNLRKFIKNK